MVINTVRSAQGFINRARIYMHHAYFGIFCAYFKHFISKLYYKNAIKNVVHIWPKPVIIKCIFWTFLCIQIRTLIIINGHIMIVVVTGSRFPTLNTRPTTRQQRAMAVLSVETRFSNTFQPIHRSSPIQSRVNRSFPLAYQGMMMWRLPMKSFQ